jgi:hypothetical protein
MLVALVLTLAHHPEHVLVTALLPVAFPTVLLRVILPFTLSVLLDVTVTCEHVKP